MLPRSLVRCLPAALFAATLAAPAYGQDTISLPATGQIQHIAADLPAGTRPDTPATWKLVDLSDPAAVYAAQVTPSLDAAGLLRTSGQCVIATVAAADPASGERQFRLEKVTSNVAPSVFRFQDRDGKSRELLEGGKHLWTYNYGVITDPDVPEKDSRRSRACYVHPVWGMSGEILTADFPKDHYHHHGIFWTWPYVKIGDQTYDLWMSSNIQQRFIRWLHEETGPVAAILGVENGWFVGDRQVATERVWLRAYHSRNDSRALDLTLFIAATDEPVTLQGRQTKSYGGMTVRFDVWPRTDGRVRVPGRELNQAGKGMASQQDLLNTPLAWADLTSSFPHGTQRSGAALFIAPDHPDYPPTWLTRTYGALCVGWPGVKPHTIAPGQNVRLDYRLWVHRKELSSDQIDRVYESYRRTRSSAARAEER